MAFKVFISHSGSDSGWTEAFVASLQQRGAEAWLDVDTLKFGESSAKELECALRNSDLFVALIAPDNLERPRLYFELGAALGMGKRVVGVVPHGFDKEQLPGPLRRRPHLVKASPDQTAQRVLAAAA
ncbi:MAG TPA: toll/interleukin-1 receptor domain-containing protein [Longimicrobium sp.]|nr:toll/interleukin-1 receptor domain-containing protein [Longimicrobium sp.]